MDCLQVSMVAMTWQNKVNKNTDDVNAIQTMMMHVTKIIKMFS